MRIHGGVPFRGSIANSRKDPKIKKVLSALSEDTPGRGAGTRAKRTPIRRRYGVGGADVVFGKRLERWVVNQLPLDPVVIAVGALAAGLPVEGLSGKNFLRRAGANSPLATLILA